MDLQLIAEKEELARDGAACVDAMKRDLVEVVRCGECDMNTEFGCALLNGLMVSKDFYCANGVRKQDAYLPVHFKEWLIDEQPTVDAVEVVRCRDCKYLGFKGLCDGVCNRKMIGIVKPDDFCSYGERRSGDE